MELPPGVKQANAAMDAFGEDGWRLLPFLKSFDGDLDGLIKKLREFGVVLTDQDVEAGNEFNKTLAEVKLQLEGVMTTLGKEFLPQVLSVLKQINSGLKENQGFIQDWSTNAGNTLRGLIGYLIPLS